MYGTDTLIIDGVKIELNSNNMKFNENSLTEYLEKEGTFYDFFGIKLAEAEHALQRAELEYDVAFADKFKQAKDDGSSDKLAESFAKSDAYCVDLKKKMQDLKLIVRKLQQHLRAWDKNHDNAQSLGFILTKEMEKLGRDRITRQQECMDDRIASLVGEVDPY